MSTAPFLRPDLDQAAEQLPLYITGKLAGGKPGDAYEGRLQIHNQIGACVVLSVTGDDLPAGGTVSIDGDEVVVAWPAYAEAAAPITNPGFEDGMAGWQGGAGWSTTTDNPIAGTRSAVFKDAPGSSILSSLSRYPVDAGDTIHASAAIRQGASSAGNAGAGVRLEFRDAAGALVGHKDGNMVMSASNNAVKPSTVTVTPGDRPAGTELVNIACHGLRKRQNREVWADTFAWDHAVAAAGINTDAVLCVVITIRDSAGRTAPWSGCVTVVSYVWDGTWAPESTGINSHWVAYSPALGRFTTGAFNSGSTVRYKDGIGGTWANGTSPAGGGGLEQIVWLPWAGIFYSTSTASGNNRWSADGITYVAGTGQPFGILTAHSPIIVQNIGGAGSAQFTRSNDGRGWVYSGSSGPGGMTSPIGVAYSPAADRFVAIFDVAKTVYSTSSTAWAAGDVLTGTVRDIFYAAGSKNRFYVLSDVGGTVTNVYESATGLAGSWTLAFSIPKATTSMKGAYSDEFGFSVVMLDESYRYDSNYSFISSQAHASLSTIFDNVWIPELGKFLVSYFGGMMLSNSTA